MFNDEGQSNYLVAFMRLLTSMQIKKEAELYINFLDGDIDVHNFCALEVEPMFKESDIVHIHALSKVCSTYANLNFYAANLMNSFSGNECERPHRLLRSECQRCHFYARFSGGK